MDDNSEQKQQVIDSLKQANNILVTVKSSPSIDQLAACIGLTLILNDQGKHGTAVFSGEVPSVLEFLEPGKTLEKNTDSLQDFIISLDKSKADKLRYKVEDSVVRIFITPYKTSITDKDLEFGQGDFNVDVVVALGVHNQDDLDQAITSHGRILHDATVISMNTDPGDSEDLGSINWVDTNRSSLSEMVASMADSLAKESKKDEDDGEVHHKGEVIDNQIATALLTGIVAETERFGNAKTTPATMETAAMLLTAGANQELVASKLSEPQKVVTSTYEDKHDDDDHDDDNHQDEGRDKENGDNGDDNHGDNDNHYDHDDASHNEDHDEPDQELMPSLIQPNDNDTSHKSVYEADENDSQPEHKDDELAVSNLNGSETTKEGDASLDITHPDEGSDSADNSDDVTAQTIEHDEPSTDEPADHNDTDANDLALSHAEAGEGAGLDMPKPLTVDVPSPDALQPPPEFASPVEPTETNGEDQAALDILKKHSVQPGAATIQPIHTHGVYIAPPSHEAGADASGGSVDVPSPSAEMEQPSGSSYGLAPPMMGGTLTSNTTDDPSSHGLKPAKVIQPPTLSHTQPDFSHLPAPLEAGASTMASPSMTPAEPNAPVNSIAQGPLIAPLTPTVSSAESSAAPAAGQTLAEIEKSTNSPHAETPGAMDMPAPSLMPMLEHKPAPEGQSEQSAAPSVASSMPLPPTPPPLIPPLSPQTSA